MNKKCKELINNQKKLSNYNSLELKISNKQVSIKYIIIGSNN